MKGVAPKQAGGDYPPERRHRRPVPASRSAWRGWPKRIRGICQSRRRASTAHYLYRHGGRRRMLLTGGGNLALL